MPGLTNEQVLSIINDSNNPAMVMDQSEAIFLAEQLRLIKSEVYEYVYPELQAKLLFPVDTEGDAGLREIIWLSIQKYGRAILVGSEGGDIPNAEISAELNKSGVDWAASKYVYSLREIKQAAKNATAGKISLQVEKAEAARRAVEERIDEIGFFGLGSLMGGFFTGSSHPLKKCKKKITEMTPLELVAFINQLFVDVDDFTFGRFKPNKLFLDRQHYHYLAVLPMNNIGQQTLLEYLVQNCEYINSRSDIVAVNRCKRNAGAIKINGKKEGTDGNDVMSAYLEDKRYSALSIPQPLQFLPTQQRDMEYSTIGFEVTGGFQSKQTASYKFAELIHEEPNEIAYKQEHVLNAIGKGMNLTDAINSLSKSGEKVEITSGAPEKEEKKGK